MKQMNGPFQATGALPRASASRPAAKLRLAGLVLTALLGSILVVWVTRTTWERVDRLQREFAGLNPNSFYLGVRMKGDIQRLNDILLRYRLRREAAHYDLFLGNVRELTQWFEANRSHAVTPLEHRFFEQMGGAYYDYLNVSTNLLVASNGRLQTKVGA